MKQSFIGAVVMLVLWIVLTFVIGIPSGWVHVPLALAVMLIARGIVLGIGPQAGGASN